MASAICQEIVGDFAECRALCGTTPGCRTAAYGEASGQCYVYTCIHPWLFSPPPGIQFYRPGGSPNFRFCPTQIPLPATTALDEPTSSAEANSTPLSTSEEPTVTDTSETETWSATETESAIETESMTETGVNTSTEIETGSETTTEIEVGTETVTTTETSNDEHRTSTSTASPSGDCAYDCSSYGNGTTTYVSSTTTTVSTPEEPISTLPVIVSGATRYIATSFSVLTGLITTLLL